MYPPPIGVLPITGLNTIGLGLTAGAFLVVGLMLVRAAYFSRSRRHH
jgi:hypothetical protein